MSLLDRTRTTWTPVCALDQLIPDRGVAAQLRQRLQAVRTHELAGGDQQRRGTINDARGRAGGAGRFTRVVATVADVGLGVVARLLGGGLFG